MATRTGADRGLKVANVRGGPGMDLKVSSTIGFEHAHQELLQVSDEDEFVERTTSAFGPQPPTSRTSSRSTAARSSATPSTRTAQPAAGPAGAGRGRAGRRRAHRAAVRRGARPGRDRHHRTTGRLGSKLAWLATPEQPLVLVGRDDEDPLEAAALAAAVGLRTIGGYLSGGMSAWREDRLDVDRVQRMTVPELHEWWRDEAARPQVLDVREQGEWNAGQIPGSMHEPYHDIREIPEGIDPTRPVAVICGSGQRSGVAASVLQRHGAEHAIHVVDGGVPRWTRGLAHGAARCTGAVRLRGPAARGSGCGRPRRCRS